MTQHATVAIWQEARRPFAVGELRSRTWRCLIPAEGDDDPLWAERAKDYWQLQERTYGVKFFDRIANAYDPDLMTMTTFATVERVLPGQRIDMRASRH